MNFATTSSVHRSRRRKNFRNEGENFRNEAGGGHVQKSMRNIVAASSIATELVTLVLDHELARRCSGTSSG